MSIFDKILGKDEKNEEKSVKTEKYVAGEKKEVEKPKKEVEAEKPKKSEKKSEPKKVKEKKPKKEVTRRKVAKKEENIAYRVLLENIISEKSTMLAAENKYVFKVDAKAGKFQIKEAIEGYYGVQVVAVNTIRIHPKKRIQGRTIGWKKGFKKAIVTLREGDTITAVEGV
jgi:large subunit ribosomal protein L23